MFTDQDVVRHVCRNGLTLLARHDRSAPVVAMVTYVRAGYFDEADAVSGIAHVLEHMFFKGTATRGVGEVARQTKACGGYLNASTIYDHTRYYAVVPATAFEAALEIQADAYANSALDGGELARELEVIIEEARRKADSPEAVTTETLFELMHDRHRIRRWRIGRAEGLRALRREDLERFYRTYYQPSNTVLGIVGDVPVSEMVRAVERLYGGLDDHPIPRDQGPAELARSGQRFRALSGDIAQSHAAFGWRVPGVLTPDSVALDLAASVLSSGRASRLYRSVRERRLAATISAWNYTPGDLGVFVVQWSGDVSQRHAVAATTWAELARCGDGVTGGELERARRQHEARTLRRMESMDGQANWLVDWESLGGWERGREYEAALRDTSAGQVAEAMRRHLGAEDASWLQYDPSHVPALAASAGDAFALVARGGAEPVGAGPSPAAVAATSRVPVRDRRADTGVYVLHTPGGVPLLIRPQRGAPMVHLGVHAVGGVAAEPEGAAGLATVMARATVKGTARRDALAIAAACDLAGGAITPTIVSDGLGWGMSVPAPRLAEAVDLLADVVMHPTFGPDVIATEREMARQQLAQLRDDMYRYPARLALAAALAGHPYARSALGTEAGLAGVKPAQARSWHEEQVVRGELVVAVTGDVDVDDVAELLAGAFADATWCPRPALPAMTWAGDGRLVVEERDKSQTAIVMAFPGPGRRDPARHAATLLAAITSGLGGRFFDALREQRSLAYTVHAGPVTRAVGGLFTAYIATSPAREDEAREGLLAEFARLREADVTADELGRARTYVLGTRAIARQGPGHVLGEVIDAFTYGAGLAELAETDEALRRVTAADIRALAERYFDPARRVEGVIRGRES